MKKNIYIILITIFLFSCSNDSLDFHIDENNKKSNLESIIIDSKENNNKHLEQIYQHILEDQPDIFNFENPNHDLFLSENNNLIKSTTQTLYANGFDKRTVLSTYNLTYTFPRTGLTQGVPYYTELCEYIKYVEIPKGYSIAIPSPAPPLLYMSALTKSVINSNMGYIPNTLNSQQGYVVKYISTSGNKDKYAFITHVEVISKNSRNNVSLNPIVYNPDGVTNPSTFSFAYQVVNLSW